MLKRLLFCYVIVFKKVRIRALLSIKTLTSYLLSSVTVKGSRNCPQFINI